MSPGAICHMKPAPEISTANHGPCQATFPHSSPEDGTFSTTREQWWSTTAAGRAQVQVSCLQQIDVVIAFI